MSMSSNRIALIIAALMCAASVGAVVLRPTTKVAHVAPFSLDVMIPKRFGDWSEDPQKNVQVISPETQALLDKLYSQIVSRTYIDSTGYRIMLSVA